MKNKLTTAKIYPYWFLLPGGLIFIVFFILPTLGSFVFAFTNWNSFNPSIFNAKFIYFDNFKDIITDPSLNIAFRNTFIFAILTTVLKCFFGLLLALLVNMQLKVKSYLRTIFFFPCVICSVAVGLIFLSLYNPSTGLVNRTLDLIGLGVLKHDWLGQLNLVIFSVCGAEVWKWSGYNMIIFVAGLSGISNDIIEAGQIDGCNAFQKFRYITFPLIRSSLNINIVLSVISGLKVFDIVYAVTNGGPGHASETFNTVVFKKFSQGFFGLSTAEGLLLFVLVMIIALPLNRYLMKKEVAA